MTITTNVGIDRSDPKYLRDKAKDHNVQLVKDAIAREMRVSGGRKLEVKPESSVVVIQSDDGGVTRDDIQRMDYFRPVSMIDDPGWPDGTGVRRDAPRLVWEAILQHRVVCFKCRWKLQHGGADCHRCSWTQAQTTAAMHYLHQRGFIQDSAARRRIHNITAAARRSA